MPVAPRALHLAELDVLWVASQKEVLVALDENQQGAPPPNMLRLPREILIAGPRNKNRNKHVKCVCNILTWIEKSIMAITLEATECKRLPISHLRGIWHAVGRPRHQIAVRWPRLARRRRLVSTRQGRR